MTMTMRIAVTGSTGLVGSALVPELRAQGHEVVRLVRPGSDVGADPSDVTWDPSSSMIEAERLEGLDAVVHLAAVNIGDSRWTVDQKARILHSRTEGTDLLARTLAGLEQPPRALLTASAIGWYGDTGDVITDEDGPPGDDFPARVCRVWEDSARPAVDAGIRVVFLRSGVVQSPEGGALAAQLPFFKLGLGGRAGSGRQYLSWISLPDEVRAISLLLDHDLDGPVNLVAPEPVTNAEYTRALGRAVRRPTTLMPMTAPRLLYGRELADSLLLTSQRIVPARLLEAGFEFEHPDIDGALRAVLA